MLHLSCTKWVSPLLQKKGFIHSVPHKVDTHAAPIALPVECHPIFTHQVSPLKIEIFYFHS